MGCLMQNIREYEDLFLATLQDEIICAAFAFQFQPADQQLSNLLLHVLAVQAGEAAYWRVNHQRHGAARRTRLL